jgi:membrane dipeptidase
VMEVDEAEALYRESIIIDMRGQPSLTKTGVDDLRISGITMANVQGDSEQAMLLNNWHINQFPGLRLVTSAEDVLQAKRNGDTGMLMSMEHPETLSQACSDHRPVLQQHLVKLEQFYTHGLRRVQLSYNRRTMFANGCTERVDEGLSYYGVELIAKMNELGILVDCAHVGITSSIDAVEVSKKPIIYSHTGCRALFDHPRSKTDEALKALAEKGGVACIYNLPYFLSAEPLKATSEDFFCQIDHAVKVMGIDHVGIGSDQGIRARSRFPSDESVMLDRATKYQEARQQGYTYFSNEINIKPPKVMPEYADTDYMLKITRGLLWRGYSEQEVKKIMGENCLRLITEVL